jgi:hypothetical protein
LVVVYENVPIRALLDAVLYRDQAVDIREASD